MIISISIPNPKLSKIYIYQEFMEACKKTKSLFTNSGSHTVRNRYTNDCFRAKVSCFVQSPTTLSFLLKLLTCQRIVSIHHSQGYGPSTLHHSATHNPWYGRPVPPLFGHWCSCQIAKRDSDTVTQTGMAAFV